MNRLILLLDRILNTVIMVVCTILLLIGLYSFADNYWLYQHAVDKSLLNYKPDLDWPLEDQTVSPYQVAWLHIFNTNIDYPVMKGKDNFEYLNKDPKGEFSLSGSIFLDFRNHSDFSDNYSLLYGHHMQRGAMFGALDRFQNEEYFEGHRTGRVVASRKVFDLELFAVALSEETDQELFNPVGRTLEDILTYLADHSVIYDPPEEGKPILAMSTCSGEQFTQRLIVFGTLQDQKEKKKE